MPPSRIVVVLVCFSSLVLVTRFGALAALGWAAKSPVAPSVPLTVIVWHTVLPPGSRSEVSPSRHPIIVDAGITHAVSG